MAGLLTRASPYFEPSHVNTISSTFTQWLPHFVHTYSCGDSPGFSPDSLLSHKRDTNYSAKSIYSCFEDSLIRYTVHTNGSSTSLQEIFSSEVEID